MRIEVISNADILILVSPMYVYLTNNIYFFVITSKCIFLQPIQTKIKHHVRHCNKSKENNC